MTETIPEIEMDISEATEDVCEYHLAPAGSICTIRVRWLAYYPCGCSELSCQGGYDYEHTYAGIDTLRCDRCHTVFTEKDWTDGQVWVYVD